MEDIFSFHFQATGMRGLEKQPRLPSQAGRRRAKNLFHPIHREIGNIAKTVSQLCWPKIRPKILPRGLQSQTTTTRLCYRGGTRWFDCQFLSSADRSILPATVALTLAYTTQPASHGRAHANASSVALSHRILERQFFSRKDLPFLQILLSLACIPTGRANFAYQISCHSLLSSRLFLVLGRCEPFLSLPLSLSPISKYLIPLAFPLMSQCSQAPVLETQHQLS